MSWLDDIAEGFADGFVPAYNKRMDRQAVEDQSILEARIRGTQDTAKARREQEARDRQRLKMANGIVGATGIGDVGLAYGLLETYGDDPKTVTEMIRSNPITSLQPTTASQPAPTPAASTVSAPSNPATFEEAKPGIFAGESGGDYNALFNFTNREGKEFSNVRLTEMTVDQALEFANPSGDYAGYVRGQVGRTATPMGAYQVVGTTLRAAKEGLGLTGNEVMTPETQDMIGKWIFDNQGVEAWVGYKAGNVPADATQDQMVAAGLADPIVREPAPAEPEAASSDNLFMTALGFNQAERDRQIDTRFNQFADATGLNSDTGGFATPESNFRLNMGPEQADLPKLGDVRASNYQALAAEAVEQGDPIRAEAITELGIRMSKASPEEQQMMADTLDAVSTTLARVNTGVIIPAQTTIDSFIGASDSAYRLMQIAADNPDILTTLGGTVPSLFSRIKNEFTAAENLLERLTNSQAPISSGISAIQEFENTVAKNLQDGSIDAQAAAYAMYNAQEMRLAFMIARSQQGSGVLSDNDFRNALAQVRSSSRVETAEESLRALINADLTKVTSAQTTLQNDPQIRIARMQLAAGGPELENLDLFDGITKPITELAADRGVSDALSWVNGDITLSRQQNVVDPQEQQDARLNSLYTTYKNTVDTTMSELQNTQDQTTRQQLIGSLAEAMGVTPAEAEQVVGRFGGETRVIRRTYVPGEGVK